MPCTSLIESDYLPVERTDHRCCALSGWQIRRTNISLTTAPVFRGAGLLQNMAYPARPTKIPHLSSCLPPTRSAKMHPSGTPRGNENP